MKWYLPDIPLVSLGFADMIPWTGTLSSDLEITGNWLGCRYYSNDLLATFGRQF